MLFYGWCHIGFAQYFLYIPQSFPFFLSIKLHKSSFSGISPAVQLLNVHPKIRPKKHIFIWSWQTFSIVLCAKAAKGNIFNTEWQSWNLSSAVVCCSCCFSVISHDLPHQMKLTHFKQYWNCLDDPSFIAQLRQPKYLRLTGENVQMFDIFTSASCVVIRLVLSAQAVKVSEGFLWVLQLWT